MLNGATISVQLYSKVICLSLVPHLLLCEPESQFRKIAAGNVEQALRIPDALCKLYHVFIGSSVFFAAPIHLINSQMLFDNVGKSDDCTQDNHASCDGIIKTVIDGSEMTKICACPCHDSSYQLVKKMFAVIKQDEE